MGCFGYICKGCNTSVRGDCSSGGEKTVMIHVRNGKELGRVEGHYDEYGRVIEQSNIEEVQKFRGNSHEINGHEEICRSELDLDDSLCRVLEKRLYNNSEYSFDSYLYEVIMDEFTTNKDIRKSNLYVGIPESYKKQIEELYTLKADEKANEAKIEMLFSFGVTQMPFENSAKLREQFDKLPLIQRDKYSGIVAWHSKCYNSATDEQKNDLTPSFSDPNQSWGKLRKKYN